MMNKKLVVSLLAGALMLPAAALAGVVNGPCVNCHTMHNSQDGTSVTGAAPNDNLLTGTGCVSCHAGAASGNNANGLSTAAGTIPAAPQVDDATDPLAGGYFVPSGTDANMHNVADFAGQAADVAIAAQSGNLPPGGSTAPVTVETSEGSTVPGLGCQGCHTQAGHHDAIDPNVYRMLAGVNTSSRPTNYGVDVTTTDGIGLRQNAAYDAAGMNGLCALCHGDFHTGNQAGTGVDAWIRHPTDISMANDATDSFPSVEARVAATYNAGNDIKQAPVGASGGNTDVVMCVSCHVAHGGPNADLLAFDYTLQVAGGASGATPGCETCHSYVDINTGM